jgi:mannose-6-phosphate isomerase-like protein (cupin superfamily)
MYTKTKSPQIIIAAGNKPKRIEEYVRGELHARIDDGEPIVLQAGQAISVKVGTKVQYSTPGADGAEYIAVCAPAYSPDTVHRQE